VCPDRYRRRRNLQGCHHPDQRRIRSHGEGPRRRQGKGRQSQSADQHAHHRDRRPQASVERV
ncbi:uncharacterized protein METZ01_LOCUS480953, partial [marine metagenome]